MYFLKFLQYSLLQFCESLCILHPTFKVNPNINNGFYYHFQYLKINLLKLKLIIENKVWEIILQYLEAELFFLTQGGF